MTTLRFRQIHLDFHTSEQIPGIGAAFDKKEWQAALRNGHVDSVTTFAKCHHGWSYHPTRVGRMHPHLTFDLLRAQFEASKEIGVNVPIYLSAGVDNAAAQAHPEWREVGVDGTYCGWVKPLNQPGFHSLCFHSPYLDYLCAQIAEVVTLFPGCDGIFLDIISQSPCCCRWCREVMAREKLNLDKEDDRKACARLALDRYYRLTTAACRAGRADMPVFHNSGHIARGQRDILPFFSHLELESLPTGGWGYDHFPLSAKYVQGLGLDFLGMTGKFHTTWGEFGGFKHPNALRYECAAMLAYGAKCSVGDQLHPDGKLDESTYAIIGAAYAEVEAKEPWCAGASNVADIGLLSSEAVNESGHRYLDLPDTGAVRVLLEGHFLFDVLDAASDFDRYRMLILPDDVRVTPPLKARLDAFLAQGGKLFLTGASGLDPDGKAFLWDVGARVEGESPFQPDFLLARPDLRPDFCQSPFVVYTGSRRLRVTTGESLGDIYDPYFNRTYEHFCSHQHAPARPEASGFAAGVRRGALCCLAHPVFTAYRALGQVALKDFIVKAIRCHLGEPTVTTTLPSTGRVTLMHQPEQRRYILHLLYANTIPRGGAVQVTGGPLGCGGKEISVIEELNPLHDVAVSLALPCPVKAATLQPQGQPLAVTRKDRRLQVTIGRLECHQMLVFDV